jgi:uncharacterized protein (DUF2147 family)
LLRQTLLLTSAALLALPAAAAPPQGAPGWSGVWRNPSNSVRIRAQPCGRGRDAGMCGTVIWASPKARADVAARGGRLIGAQLFRDFYREDDGLWHGEVYVPDLDKTFSGTLTQRGRDTLVGEGCLFAGLGCRTQTWTRVK